MISRVVYLTKLFVSFSINLELCYCYKKQVISECLLSDYVSPCTTLIGVTGRGNFKDRQIFAPCSYCISSTSHRDFKRNFPLLIIMYTSTLIFQWYSCSHGSQSFWLLRCEEVSWGYQVRITRINKGRNTINGRGNVWLDFSLSSHFLLNHINSDSQPGRSNLHIKDV